MGAIDLLNQAYFTATRPFDRLTNARLGTRLMRGGTEARGRIDGIKTTQSEASSNQWIWVFSVTVRPGSADSFRVAFQQNLMAGGSAPAAAPWRRGAHPSRPSVAGVR